MAAELRRRIGWIVAAALALRLALLFARGDYIVYDEGYYVLLARSLREGHGYTLGGLPHVALSPLQPALVALVSATGLPDLLVSRLLGAVCSALLVIPVAALAGLAAGPTAALLAGSLVAASPALMSFVPFFPGESWNLYFGSEPLFLLAAFGALAAAARADAGARWTWWALAGGLMGAAFLARAEGVVLALALLGVLGVRLLVRRAGGAGGGAGGRGGRGALARLSARDRRGTGGRRAVPGVSARHARSLGVERAGAARRGRGGRRWRRGRCGGPRGAARGRRDDGGVRLGR